MNLPVATSDELGLVLARTLAVRELEIRFGWLRDELYRAGGSVSSLAPHKQMLWHGRQKAVARLNAISRIADPDKRLRAYKKLTRSLKQRIATP